MIVDTSALIAILKDEPEAETFARAIEIGSGRVASLRRAIWRHMIRCGRGTAILS